jgi:hypothetical protein
MKITLENYQEYAAEWLDGTLSHELAEAFGRFLAVHPMIRDGIEEAFIADKPAKGTDSAGPDFSSLKKTINDKTINSANFLEFVMAKMDGELNESSLISLEGFLNANPELQKEAGLFELTVQEPDNSVVFKGKEVLCMDLAMRALTGCEEQLDELIIASLEGELSAEAQDRLGAFMAAHPAARQRQRSFEKTFLQPDLSIVYPDKGTLKRRNVVFLPDRRRLIRGVAVAASMALMAGIFLFDRNEELLITQPGGEMLALTTGSLRIPMPVIQETVVASADVKQSFRKQIMNSEGAVITVQETIPRPMELYDPYRPDTRIAAAIPAATHADVLSVPERRPLAHSVADASGITPTRPRRAIDEFPIEQIRYFTGGGNERPGLLAQLTLPRIIEATNPYERINNAGQVILTRWAEWKGKALDEVIPYR